MRGALTEVGYWRGREFVNIIGIPKRMILVVLGYSARSYHYRDPEKLRSKSNNEYDDDIL